MSKRFISTRIIVVATSKGVGATKDTPGVSPKIEEKPIGTTFKATDFEREEFVAFLKNGTLVEDMSDDQDAASSYYDTEAGKDAGKETEEKRRERLMNEAKLLGVSTTKNMKVETLEAKIAEAREEAGKRDDGTTPSTQEGAGRTDGNAGGDSDGAGGDAAGGDTGGGSGDENLIG